MEIAQKSIQCVLHYLIEAIQMLYVENYSYFFYNASENGLLFRRTWGRFCTGQGLWSMG